MQVVTSGAPYMDIDGYGGCVAYAELLNAQGTKAIAATTAPLNISIPPSVREWGAPLAQDYQVRAEDSFTLIDISEPEFFDKLVTLERVNEVIDHHPGYEKYWQEKLGKKAEIEFVGAACTLVCEAWAKAELLNQMSQTSARLLICGILDNTLNFGARITTARDHQAYAALLPLAHLPETWTADYFNECLELILADFDHAVRDDTKLIVYPSQTAPMAVGQLTLWNADEVIPNKLPIIAAALSARSPAWFMNILSLRDGKSYLICEDNHTQQWLSNLLRVTFSGNVATADRLWLRKEIMKQAIERQEPAHVPK